MQDDFTHERVQVGPAHAHISLYVDCIYHWRYVRATRQCRPKCAGLGRDHNISQPRPLVGRKN
jgi:hypothetical protein